VRYCGKLCRNVGTRKLFGKRTEGNINIQMKCGCSVFCRIKESLSKKEEVDVEQFLPV
jgi:hypothetical protein